MKIHVIEFANRISSEEAAHNEPSHLGLQCLFFL